MVISVLTISRRDTMDARSASGAVSQQLRAISALTSCSIPYSRRHGEHSSRWLPDVVDDVGGELTVEVEVDRLDHV